MMNNQKEDAMSYGITGLLVMFWPIFLFCIAAIFPITTHSGWYKRVIRKGIGKKVNYGNAVDFILACIGYRNYFIGSERSKRSKFRYGIMAL